MTHAVIPSKSLAASRRISSLLDRPVRYKVPGHDPLPNSIRRLANIAMSREFAVLSGILGTTMCLASLVPVLVSQYSPLHLLLCFMLGYVGLFAAVCVFSVLVFLKSLVSPSAKPIEMSSGLVHMLTLAVIFLVLLFGTQVGTALLEAEPQITLWTTLGILVIATGLSELLARWFHTYIVPVGSPRWKRLAAGTPAREDVTQMTHPDPQQTRSERVQIGPHKIELARLWSLNAEGNYVIVQTARARHIVRATFSSVLETIPDGYGVKAHRSTWVAFAAIENVTQKKNSLTLALKDGSSLDVPKARFATVSQALKSKNLLAS